MCCLAVSAKTSFTPNSASKKIRITVLQQVLNSDYVTKTQADFCIIEPGFEFVTYFT